MNAKRIVRIQVGEIAVLGLAVVLLLTAGCAVGPNYKRPVTDTPSEIRFARTNGQQSLAAVPWRMVFQDPPLQELIASALTNNYTLQQAIARVEQARYSVVATRSELFPQIGYAGDISRGKNSLLNTPTTTERTSSSAAAVLNAAWEIDLWGRIRRLTEAARARYLATDEARRGVTITLVSDIAASYYQLLGLDEELQIQRAATNAYAGSYRIFNDRRLNGVASKLETDRAAAALATAAATIPALESQIGATENRLNILIGRPPGPVTRSSLTNQPQAQLEIPVGLPSELLRRRPDVLASEQSLVAANAEIGANVANFFPRLGLTAFLGKVSPELSAFTGGAANAWNIGANLVGPLFQGGRLYAEYKGSKAAYVEAEAGYRQTVITAFQEVSDSLIVRQKLAESLVFDRQAVEALTSSVGLATDRYVNGNASYFEVLQAQQELYPAQSVEVRARAGEWIAVVQLYRALGGGWDAAEEGAMAGAK